MAVLNRLRASQSTTTREREEGEEDRQKSVILISEVISNELPIKSTKSAVEISGDFMDFIGNSLEKAMEEERKTNLSGDRSSNQVK